MPFPLMAAASLAATMAGNLPSLQYDGNDDEEQLTEEEKEKKQNVGFDKSNSGSSRDAVIIDSVRSYENEYESTSMFNVIARDGCVHLRRLGNKETTEALNNTPGLTTQGYIDGSFSSGVTHEIRPGGGSFVLRYSDRLLAVGTVEGLELYETRNYSQVFHIPTKDEISAIRWLKIEDSPSSSYLQSHRLLAFGCLDGACFLYLVDDELLEVEGGVSLLFSCQMKGQVRALDCSWYRDDDDDADVQTLDPTIVLAFGDKVGNVQLTSFDKSFRHRETIECEYNDSAVLGLSIHESQRWIARCTKHGNVAVHLLQRQSATRAIGYGPCLWETDRDGPVLTVAFSQSGTQLAIGGYDKTVALIDTSAWALFRKFQLEGTVNAIAMDSLDRYIAVGCRDRTLTIFDSSTYMKIKTFQTNGWVSDLSWNPAEYGHDILAFRPKRHLVSVINLQPIEVTDLHLKSRHGTDSSLSWSADGRLLMRSYAATVFVVDVDQNFQQVASASFSATVIKVLFCKAKGKHDRVAVMDETGLLTVLRLLPKKGGSLSLDREVVAMVEVGIKTMAWSPDGSVLALGGKQNKLHLLDCLTLTETPESGVNLDGRIWDIAFAPASVDSEDIYIVLALGDYTCVAFNRSMEIVLRFARSRTVRCLAVHPANPILVVGDGAGIVAVVDMKAAELVHEIKTGGGRISTLEFSPVGDYLVVGTDDAHFNLYLDGIYQLAQQFPCTGFAVCAHFAPDGAHLAFGSAGGSYTIVRLGPFLGIDLAPLTLSGGTAELPEWALAEVLYRSGYSESFLQRHIQNGHPDDIRRLSSILKAYPNAVFTFDRSNNETFFDTALRMRRPIVLKLVITALVDGSLESSHDRSILSTRLPQQAREALVDLLINTNPEFVADILKDMEFMKVPYGQVCTVRSIGRFEKGTPSTVDPWGSIEKDREHSFLDMFSWSTAGDDQQERMLTPAVLPLPGLGQMEFLSSLLWNAPPDVFDNAAMGVILRVLWTGHIRNIFYMDFFLFICFYGCWIALVESKVGGDSWDSTPERPTNGLPVIVLLLNSVFGVKETVEAGWGRGAGYFRNFWNAADILSIVFVYAFVGYELLQIDSKQVLVPLAVTTTFAMTIKIISYLRGFDATGWLISVLSANFRDVRGFLFILFAILVGFSVAFRVLFSEVNDEGFGSLRRSFLSTFELVTTGSYEPSMLYGAEWNVLAALTFVLAVTCVLVIALNALISILADSYARVQENAVANRRKEQAGLIVEYMTLLPAKSRRQLEDRTRWFHCLLEVDSDGALLLGNQDWQGGLNALRKDLEELSQENRENNEKALMQIKNELYAELSSFRKETQSLLANLTAEVKELKKASSPGGIKINGKNVVNAVKAFKSIGEKTARLIRQDSNGE